ncbi:hypothetical protein H9P43_008267 [Blastocladiella emersonii ATCC 22665]|nr:hypothetical protein H9P43_008267 [Blastocladiella emersonii ATCC 22665]
MPPKPTSAKTSGGGSRNSGGGASGTSSKPAAAAVKPEPAADGSTGADPATRPVRVVLRVRPRKQTENEECLALDEAREGVVRLPLLNDVAKCAEYQLDRCYPPAATQDDLFHLDVQPVLDRALQGVNATVFAYGMTGAGKTFTIEGTADHPGMVYKAMQYLFDRTASLSEVAMTMSFFEIYCEEVIDLLAAHQSAGTATFGVNGNTRTLSGHIGTKPLAIREASDGRISIAGLTTVPVSEYQHFVAAFKKASATRSVARTDLNATSSRSHLVIQVTLEGNLDAAAASSASTGGGSGGASRFSKVNIVDLAGSENNKRTGNKDQRMKESGSINKSLFNLGQVVDALNSKRARVPYRESKLTRILQDSLGGSAHALIIANVAPSTQFLGETTSTLQFADKSRKIVNRPVANVVPEKTVVRIGSSLDADAGANDVPPPPANDRKRFPDEPVAAARVAKKPRTEPPAAVARAPASENMPPPMSRRAAAPARAPAPAPAPPAPAPVPVLQPPPTPGTTKALNALTGEMHELKVMLVEMKQRQEQQVNPAAAGPATTTTTAAVEEPPQPAAAAAVAAPAATAESQVPPQTPSAAAPIAPSLTRVQHAAAAASLLLTPNTRLTLAQEHIQRAMEHRRKKEYARAIYYFQLALEQELAPHQAEQVRNKITDCQRKMQKHDSKRKRDTGADEAGEPSAAASSSAVVADPDGKITIALAIGTSPQRDEPKPDLVELDLLTPMRPAVRRRRRAMMGHRDEPAPVAPAADQENAAPASHRSAEDAVAATAAGSKSPLRLKSGGKRKTSSSVLATSSDPASLSDEDPLSSSFLFIAEPTTKARQRVLKRTRDLLSAPITGATFDPSQPPAAAAAAPPPAPAPPASSGGSRWSSGSADRRSATTSRRGGSKTSLGSQRDEEDDAEARKQLAEQLGLTPRADRWLVATVNSGDEDRITSLKGIGSSRAQQLVAHTALRGQLVSATELCDVPGFGPKIVRRIVDSLPAAAHVE